MKQRILLIAGGTGGHLFPAISLGEYLLDTKNEVLMLTDNRGIKLMANTELNYVKMPLNRKPKSIFGWLLFILRILISTFFALVIIIKFKPNKIVTFSGFPTLPGIMASILLFKTVYIHEQNAVLGAANRFAAKFVKKIFTSYNTVKLIPKHALHKIYLVGMPVRHSIQKLVDKPYELNKETFNLLITGGSQGALSFSQIIPIAIAKLSPEIQKKLTIIHQSRPEDKIMAEKLYAKTLAKFTVLDFIHDFPNKLANAHLVIARSGASTIAEICAAGKPAIFIPYPYARDNHQFYNAQIIQQHSGGWVIKHENFSPEILKDKLQDLFSNPEQLINASNNIRQVYQPKSLMYLAEELLKS